MKNRNVVRAWALAAGLLAAASVAGAAPKAPTSRYSMEALTELECGPAVDRINEGLEAKDREAMYALGQMHDEGWCVSRDAEKAVRMWRMAVEAGHPAAVGDLALKIGRGDGVPQDYAAAGEVLRNAGVRIGGVEFPDTYSLGYAYTWMRLTQREMAAIKELSSLGAIGLADVEFDPRKGVAQALSFRRTDGYEPPVGTRIDRSRSVVRQAVAQAADAARSKLAKPDPQRLADMRFREQFGIAPGADYEGRDVARRVGPGGIMLGVGNGGVIRNN